MPPKKILILGVLSGLSACGYLIASQLLNGIGFPLDDSWIHQVYARNLGLHGQWAFALGEPSAGATAPLWVALISPAYLLGIEPKLWTFILGWLTLWGLAVLSANLFELLSPKHSGWGIWIGIGVSLEWHLVWAAVSGMETLLFGVFVLAEFVLMIRILNSTSFSSTKRLVALGLLIGVSTWVRPEGVVVMGILVVGLLISNTESSFSPLIKKFITAGIGFLAAFGLYLLFNQFTAGDWWPNTFHAKQAEFASYQTKPIVSRFFEQTIQLFVGIGALVLPGFLFYIYQRFRRKAWRSLLPIFWIFGHLFLYAWRLPVNYQHGRYAIPVMPVFFVLGLIGMLELVKLNSENLRVRIFSRTWALSVLMIAIVFWLQGAKSYAIDVAIIESEMVAVAKWVSVNIGDGDLVAAHDIGALGYFTNVILLDTAGLVNPEVIPFLGDDVALGDYLNKMGARYLITFPGFYSRITTDATVVYRTSSEISPSQGGANLVVYDLK